MVMMPKVSSGLITYIIAVYSSKVHFICRADSCDLIRGIGFTSSKSIIILSSVEVFFPGLFIVNYLCISAQVFHRTVVATTTN